MEFIAGRVIGLLGSLAAKQLEIIYNFKDDLESMESMVRAIKAVLLDAEKKATGSHLINDWLQKLKDVLLDAEDLLDACLAEELGRKVMTKDIKMAKEVCIFFSKYNRIVCAATMGREIKVIRKRLDGIFKEKNNLHLSEISPNASTESNDGRQTHSFVREEDVVGREAEKRSLVSTILNSNVKKNVSAVPIVGIGGLGKTTLAQQVYNDEAVKKHFELMKFVCVSDESSKFSIERIAQNITGDKYDTMEQAAQGLRKTIEGKRFLLVLDDVWNEDREKWLELESLLRGGKEGSMIIVTTRSEKVAQIMGTIDEPFRLRDLDFIRSWELFCRVAFKDGKEPENQELVVIGKDIVRRCSGVPLAIRTVGSLLFTEGLGVREWSYFRDNELANMGSDKGNKTFSILKLSYDHLPSHLKNCFAFCSLFPKDYLIERKTLIQLWIAEGFIIEPLDESRCLEDVGDDYFKQLLSRCFFQDVRRNNFGDIEYCKMHDLIHDLAHSITKNDCYIVTGDERIEEEKLSNRIRHVSCHFDGDWKYPINDDAVRKFLINDVKTKKVRTILVTSGGLQCGLIYDHATSLPKHLRVLALGIQEDQIPKSIQDLKQLRHLDLTRRLDLEKLPPGIIELHNLVTLILNQCENLIELPKDMKRLVRLRHLELDDCDKLMFMPFGLGCLTDLQTLTRLVVDDKRSGGARISELRDLRLRGRLQIRGLERQRSNIKEVESSKFLLHMPYLLELKLVWPLFRFELLLYTEEEVEQKDEIILEALEPPHTIKALYIEGFAGQCLSKWIWSTTLQTLYLENFTTLASLPESIGSLTSLQTLRLVNCYALASLPESFGSLTSLRRLSLYHCPYLALLPESFGNLTSLQALSLENCFYLASLPESFGNLTTLQTLYLNYCPALTSLQESFGNLTTLQKLHVDDCLALASLPKSLGSLTSLRTLYLDCCYALASLPESIGSLASLQTLELLDCYALASLPNSIKNLTSLKRVHISNCTALGKRYGQKLEDADWPGLAHMLDVRIH